MQEEKKELCWIGLGLAVRKKDLAQAEKYLSDLKEIDQEETKEIKE